MQDHGARAHHRFGGSGMARLMLCPGSYNMSRAVPPETPSRAAMRGTLAHEIMDGALQSGEREAWAAAIPYHNHELYDDDLVNGVQVALDYVYEILDAYGDECELHCEREFILDCEADDDVGGYCDVAIWVPSLGILYIIDYKNGVVAVEAEGNKQVKFYATGAVEQYFHGAETIIGVIVQPNSFHKNGSIRQFICDRSDIDEYKSEVNAAIAAAKDPNAPLRPSEYACEWCPARAFCPARETAALAVASKTFATVKMLGTDGLPDPVNLSGDRLADIMSKADILRGWLDDVEKAAYSMMMSGGQVPGYKLVEAQARRKWYGEPAQVAAALEALLGENIDTVFPRKLMTITDAERYIKKRYTSGLTKKADKDKALADAYAYMARLTNKDTSGNLTLAHESDKREAVRVKDASVTFGSVQILPPA